LLNRSLLAKLIFLMTVGAAANAQQPAIGSASDFQSLEFHAAMVKAMQARFDSFAELKSGTAVSQLPQMSCQLSSTGSVTSYLCSSPSVSEAAKLLDSLIAAVGTALPGYPRCDTTANDPNRTSFCRAPQIPLIDASVHAGQDRVFLEIYSRAAGDSSQPAQFLHAYALADLGRHAEAIQALQPILHADKDSDLSEQVLGPEHSIYDRATQWTQSCAQDKSCVAEDFLSAGKPAEALIWQGRLIKTLHAGQQTNLHKGQEMQGGNLTVRTSSEVDSTGGKSVPLADAYDLNARIEAALGKFDPALHDLDTAIQTLPNNDKAAARKAEYDYHRALILAENQRYAEAANACRNSLNIAEGDPKLKQHRQPQCQTIDALAALPSSRR
jgi:tetratricopeptide (TPR) repeat protein